nr:PQQ-dependent sugar dehydrogenase [Thermoleophilaceae bacterium]
GSLLGKLVSLDVDAKGEQDWRVDLYGLRNPWRFWFDPAMNEVWIADVGQDAYEEIHRVPLEPDEPPKNLGWPVYEGVTELTGKDVEGNRLEGGGELIFPVAGYSHDDGCSVTGGAIYRGRRVDDLEGRYVYGDFCSGALWTLRPKTGGGAQDVRRERAKLPQVTHIGPGARGELVMAAATGEIFSAAALRAP